MTAIERTWTQFPPDRYSQKELIELLPHWLQGSDLALARRLFERSAVSWRHLISGPDEVFLPGRALAQRNARYKECIRSEVGALCANIRSTTSVEVRASIDLLITASCTGFQIPAMDTIVICDLDLPLALRRLNLTEHGCSAGANAIGLAHEWLLAHPGKRALVVCSEFCSLTFQPEDTSAENLVSAAIFGDGSAAVLLAGPEVESRGGSAGNVHVRDTWREFFPSTEHFMGYEVNDLGFKIKLSQDIVKFSHERLPDLFARACAGWKLEGPQAFEFGSIHPGGRRILEILEKDAGIPASVTETSWECLRDFGNMSSVSVLASLDRLLAKKTLPRPNAFGLISAFGPGFGVEMSLLEYLPPAA